MEGRVLIIGLGLIGGSLAMCIKEKHPDAELVGYDLDQNQMNLAKMLGVIDRSAEGMEEEALEADLIILATPVMVAGKIIETLASLPLKQEVIITDTGSTKGFISQKASILSDKGISFIGGHPMAGSHKSGVAAAKKLLFENAFYLLTPASHVRDSTVDRLKSWLSGTKAKFLKVSPEEHDYLTGVVSHFPHVIAASLVHQAARADKEKPLVNRLAAGGFRDITRIASSNPRMWRDILLQNSDVLVSLLSDWQAEMERVKELLTTKDEDKIHDYFDAAKKYRDGLPVNDKGAIPSFYDLFVDVPDYPGIISEVTGYLATERISITNIRIMETREDIYGVLVISFQTPEDREKAMQCIGKYTEYEMSVAE
ncbi:MULTISPECIES: prephenate dehydrogenase [Mesobacillus]|uniref:Prephenate dehydrogenase n=2 Tax=Mesobacillus TaxID=2675231 RepID=A0A0D6ZAP6_9BACI|nr:MULTISPECIES: prephenate dehydrogenase [Mesobacillus]KIY22121.1 prephenate dehydrogenase [Mesobacillus subterraneus]MDQ0412104.1 prephenate dehydrogenase [Mesobacillus stamsii]